MKISTEQFFNQLDLIEGYIQDGVSKFVNKDISEIDMQRIANMNLMLIKALQEQLDDDSKEIGGSLDPTQFVQGILSKKKIFLRQYVVLQRPNSTPISPPRPSTSLFSTRDSRKLDSDEIEVVESKNSGDLDDSKLLEEPSRDSNSTNSEMLRGNLLEHSTPEKVLDMITDYLKGVNPATVAAVEQRLKKVQKIREELDAPPPIYSKELRRDIMRVISSADFPLPADPPTMAEASQWSHEMRIEILRGNLRVRPQFLQAVRYLDRVYCSEVSREDRILADVYLGNIRALKMIRPDMENNPTHFTRVISVTSQNAKFDDRSDLEEMPVERAFVEINESAEAWENLQKREFFKLFPMIDEARSSKEPILIHCLEGRSESVVLMAAYMINRFMLTTQEALTFIKAKRFIAEPTPALRARLESYRAYLGS